MLKRQTEGSVICTSCGVLVGVNDDTCYNCGRRNPGLWGYAPALRRLGQDLGFVPLVMGGTITLYVLSLLLSGTSIQGFLSPSTEVLFLLGASGALPVFEYGRWWTVLTAGLAARRRAARALQRDVDPAAGAGRRRSLRRRPDGDHLHRGRRDGVCRQLAGRDVPSGRCPSSAAPCSRSARRRRSSGCWVPWSTTGGAPATATRARPGCSMRCSSASSASSFPGVDNWAHAGGFAGGFLASLVLDPLTRERVDHLVAGARLPRA